MGKIELMALPYAKDALEPVISKQTLEFHHGKHLAGYVNNLNGLLPGSGFEEMTMWKSVYVLYDLDIKGVGHCCRNNR